MGELRLETTPPVWVLTLENRDLANPFGIGIIGSDANAGDESVAGRPHGLLDQLSPNIAERIAIERERKKNGPRWYA